MPLYEEWWFWIIIIGVLFIIIAFVLWAFFQSLRWWFWFLLILGIVIAIIGIVWWYIDRRNPSTNDAAEKDNMDMYHQMSQSGQEAPLQQFTQQTTVERSVYQQVPYAQPRTSGLQSPMSSPRVMTQPVNQVQYTNVAAQSPNRTLTMNNY